MIESQPSVGKRIMALDLNTSTSFCSVSKEFYFGLFFKRNPQKKRLIKNNLGEEKRKGECKGLEEIRSGIGSRLEVKLVEMRRTRREKK